MGAAWGGVGAACRRRGGSVGPPWGRRGEAWTRRVGGVKEHLDQERRCSAFRHAGWQWMLCKGQTQRLLFVNCSFTARWRIVAVSGGLENPPLDNCNWIVKSNSDGVARSSPLSRKKKVCKHQSYAKRCILRAPRHKTPSLIIAGPPTDQTVR